MITLSRVSIERMLVQHRELHDRLLISLGPVCRDGTWVQASALRDVSAVSHENNHEKTLPQLTCSVKFQQLEDVMAFPICVSSKFARLLDNSRLGFDPLRNLGASVSDSRLQRIRGL